jgi:hypothetical protein
MGVVVKCHNANSIGCGGFLVGGPIWHPGAYFPKSMVNGTVTQKQAIPG